MATTCVFVTVSEGVKTLIRTVDVEVNQKHTFDELLDIVLELKDVVLESFDERKVTVTMRATLSSPSVEIGKRTATVASRIGAGHFVAFNRGRGADERGPTTKDLFMKKFPGGIYMSDDSVALELIKLFGVGEVTFTERLEAAAKVSE
ncbi:hypothetical protein M885DRAFT_625026 [Pelagophyceae sp. CCMP2097]|nr:hypothetical protein M885DRAFT_625026 [Pelagophyceae sp. CCMP2097]